MTEGAPAADLVLYGGNVATLDPAQPEAEAVAVLGERIVAVGSDAEVRRLPALTRGGSTFEAGDSSGLDGQSHPLPAGGPRRTRGRRQGQPGALAVDRRNRARDSPQGRADAARRVGGHVGHVPRRPRRGSFPESARPGCRRARAPGVCLSVGQEHHRQFVCAPPGGHHTRDR